MRKALAGALFTVFAVMCWFVPTAHAADSYLNTVAATVQSTNTHVWQDPNVPIISQAQVTELEQKIAASGKPIYVAIVDQGKLSSTNSSDFPKLYHDALQRDGAYVVVGLKAFRAAGFNTSYAVANNAPTIATAAFNNAKARGATKPDFQALNELVTGIIVLDFTKPTAPSTTMPMGPTMMPQPSAPSQTSSWAWLWWLLGIVTFGWAIFFVIFFAHRRKKRAQDEADRIAREAREDEEARIASQPTFTNYPHDEKPREERASFVGVPSSNVTHATKHKESSGGNTRTTYSTYSNRHPHYWNGGTVNGQYYGPGYYADNFWVGYMLGSMNGGDHHDHHHSDGGYSGGTTHHSAPAPALDPEPSSSSSSYDSGYGGGGDFTSTPVTPTYSAPKPASPPSPPAFSLPTFTSPSSGGFDFGGGGGGFTSGGGGGGDFS